jgi:hypothetical protein
LNVLFDFLLLLFALIGIANAVSHCLSDFDDFKAKASIPLSLEGFHLLLSEEGRSE